MRLCEAPDLRIALEKTAPPVGPIIHSANCFFALKIMKKSEVVRLKQVEHIKNEKEILQDVNHPFIVVLCAAPARAPGTGRGGQVEVWRARRVGAAPLAHGGGTRSTVDRRSRRRRRRYHAFQDERNLYMLLEYIIGGSAAGPQKKRRMG